jgi:cell division protein FtsI/penicillin-binding protein 2
MEDRWANLQETIRSSRRRRRGRRRLAALLLGLLVAAGYGAGRIAPRFEAPEPQLERLTRDLPPSQSCRDVLCSVSWPTPTLGADGVYEQRIEGHRAIYTLDPELQEQALSVFRQYKVPYGAFVAIEPSTGKVLALAEYSREEPDLHDFCRRATYPAASLIKVITAVAALEGGVATPSTSISFEGNPYRLYPRKISQANGWRENNKSTLAEALGKSNNVVFAKLGLQVGLERLTAGLESFGFNRSLPFDFALQDSRAIVPPEPYPLARTAAGFGEVYLSPVHAALIAAAVGNGGVMMRPYVVDALEDAKGVRVYQAAPAPLLRVASEKVARQVGGMMEKTVTSGTSAKVFFRNARKLRADVGVAGKTGSLTGDDPPGKYEWFIGFAPADDPKIAVASLIVNHDLWHIKGTYVAQAVMKEFFGM